MGVIIPFAEIKRARSPASTQPFTAVRDDERGIRAALLAGADQSEILATARPLLDRCRDHYGFVIMRDGLPKEPAILGRALQELYRGLSMLDAEIGAPRTYPTFGVYFDHQRLAWFEDGYSGTTGLAVPNEIKAADLAAFVRPRIAARLRSEQ